MTPARMRTHADAAVRAQRAWAARVAGATWQEAAEVSGFTETSNCIRAVRSYFGTLPAPDRDELRLVWRERLEELWRQVRVDAAEQRPGAVRAAVAVAQRAVQLDGLDAPQRVSVESPDMARIEELLARFAVVMRGDVQEADVFAVDAEVVDDDGAAVAEVEGPGSGV